MKPARWMPLVLSLVLTASAGAGPRFAVIRIKDIYTAQPAVRAAETMAKEAKEQVMHDPRAEELRSAIESMRAIQASINQSNKQLSNHDARKTAREFEIKRLETKTLQEDFEKFSQQREREINTKLVREIRAILSRIEKTSRQTAIAKGYELVFDTTGFTNSGLPFLLYAKDAPDLTEEVLAALKAEEATQPSAEGSPVAQPSPDAEPAADVPTTQP